MENAENKLLQKRKERGLRAFFSTLFETIPEDHSEELGLLDDEFFDDEEWNDDSGSEELAEEFQDSVLQTDKAGDENPEMEEFQKTVECAEGKETDISIPEKTVSSAEHPDVKAFFERGKRESGEKHSGYTYQPLVSRYDKGGDSGKNEGMETGSAGITADLESSEPERLEPVQADAYQEAEIPLPLEDLETPTETELGETADTQETAEENSAESDELKLKEERVSDTEKTSDSRTEKTGEGTILLNSGDSVSESDSEEGVEPSKTGGSAIEEQQPLPDMAVSEEEQLGRKQSAEESEGKTSESASEDQEGKQTAYQPLVSRYEKPSEVSETSSVGSLEGASTAVESATSEPEKESPKEQNNPEDEIQLFEEESEDSYAHFGDTGKMKSVRTGFGTTTRIHLNQTEEMQRAEAAQQRAEELQKEEQTAARKVRKKKRTKILRILKKLFSNIAFVLFLIAAFLVGVYYAFLLSDVMILGNEKYSSEYILGISGLQKGRHMLMIDMDEAKAKIEDNPYLEVEQMTFIFPNRIRIVIKERQEIAGIVGVDYSVIIDDQGYVLSMAGGTDLSSLVRVTGVSMTGFQLGQKLGEGNDFSTATLVQIIEKLEEYNLIEKISAIDLTTPLAITMTARNGLNIHLGQSTDLDAKMASLSKLIDAFTEKYISTGTLYLSAKGGTVYSPSDAAKRAAEAAIQANIPTYSELTLTGSEWVDEDEDGYDDNTGNPLMTPEPTPPPATPAPTPLAGGSDEFSG